MKQRLIIISVAACALLAATPSGRAIPPRQHSASGVITSTDDTARTLTLAPLKGSKPLVFVWDKSTRFTQRGSRICNGALEPGQSVTVSYRREVGRLASREVRLQSDAPTRCATGDCCRKRSNP
jgi:hypothetical protein